MKSKILISTGGSGGHVLPAITIYDHLKSNYDTLISIDDILLKGKHNLSNFIASATAAKILNVKNKKIKKTMELFTGIKHRLQFVKSIKGSSYFATFLSSCFFLP